MNRSKKIAAGAAGVLAAVAIGAGAWVALDDEQESAVRGVCGQATYELSIEAEDGLSEASFELQSGTPGESWDVEVRHGDTSVLQGPWQTDTDGEIDLDVAVPDGADEIAVVATPAQGEPCTVTLTR